MAESNKDDSFAKRLHNLTPVKHVVMTNRYHWALKKYAVDTDRTSKSILEEALEKMPGFKEFLE